MVTPSPLNDADTFSQTTQALDSATSDQEPVKGPIDLAEAMARAVLYNGDARVAQFELALRDRQLASASIASLPALTLNAGYAARDKYESSNSLNLRTGRSTTDYTTSQDRKILTDDLTLSWNILDFGLSYVQAQQAANQVLIAREARRRATARIVEEVRSAYWRALAAEYLGRELRVLEQEARAALKDSQALVDSGRSPPLAALSFQREIYDLTDRLQSEEAEVAAARSQLAALMNLPPGTQFTLVRPAVPALPSVNVPFTDLVKEALTHRAELREALYDQRNAELDGTKALLELLPGINLSVASNATSNSLTRNPEWVSWGSRASWNLMRLASYPIRSEEVEARQDLSAERLKATTASIALQVYVSRIRYELAQRRAETLGQYADVQSTLLQKSEATVTNAQFMSQNELLREKLGSLLARARRDVAVADAQSSYSAILTSLGA